MKFFELALLAAVAGGCTGTSPTAPTNPGQPPVPTNSGIGVSADRAARQKVTLYFHDTDDGVVSPPGDVVGLSVSIVSVAPDTATVAHTTTNRQGAAAFWIPADITEIAVTTGSCGTHGAETETFVPIVDFVLSLPINTREGWLRVHETDPNAPCTLP